MRDGDLAAAYPTTTCGGARGAPRAVPEPRDWVKNGGSDAASNLSQVCRVGDADARPPIRSAPATRCTCLDGTYRGFYLTTSGTTSVAPITFRAGDRRAHHAGQPGHARRHQPRRRVVGGDRRLRGERPHARRHPLAVTTAHVTVRTAASATTTAGESPASSTTSPPRTTRRTTRSPGTASTCRTAPIVRSCAATSVSTRTTPTGCTSTATRASAATA